MLKSYGVGPYTNQIKTIEEDISKLQDTVKELIGIKESDTGLSQPSQWDLVSDKQMIGEEAPLQVARCTQIMNPGQPEEQKYCINIKQIAKFVVGNTPYCIDFYPCAFYLISTSVLLVCRSWGKGIPHRY